MIEEKKDRTGLSLLELLIVGTILTFVGIAAVGKYNAFVQKAEERRTIYSGRISCNAGA